MATNVEKKPQQTEDHEDFLDTAKNALIFAVLFMVLVVALWGYVYLTMLERGMTQ